jgi:uncharacterized membrane protein YdjX (TVP38/TMEM64 family)
MVIAVLVLGAAYALHQHGMFHRAIDWVEQVGLWGPFWFLGGCIAAGILFVPSVAVAVTAGALFGPIRGMLLSLVGNGLGAVGALLIGRYVARGWATRAFAHRRTFQLVSDLVRRKGWTIVVLARLSPVMPFLVGNYAFGLTLISARSYGAASIIGSIPSTAVYAYLGALGRDVALLGDPTRARTPLEWGLVCAGLIVTGILAVYLKRLAQRALREG